MTAISAAAISTAAHATAAFPPAEFGPAEFGPVGGGPLPSPRTRSEYLRHGHTDAEIRADLAGGRLTRLCTGVYVATKPYLALRADQRYVVRVRAEAARSPGLVVSHLSAGAYFGLPIVRTSLTRVHFTRPGRGGSRRNRRRWVHFGDLPDGYRVTVDGIELTTLARTLVDIGRAESLDTAVAVADGALHAGLVTSGEITAALEDARFHPGIAKAKRALRSADGRSESPGESLLRIALRTGGVPQPDLQVEIHDEDGRFVARTDLALLAYGIILEFDGYKKYTSLLRPGQDVVDVVMAEKQREQRLTELGWLVIRVTWDELREPEILLARIQRACQARRQLVAAGGVRGTAIPRPPVTIFG